MPTRGESAGESIALLLRINLSSLLIRRTLRAAQCAPARSSLRIPLLEPTHNSSPPAASRPQPIGREIRLRVPELLYAGDLTVQAPEAFEYAVSEFIK